LQYNVVVKKELLTKGITEKRNYYCLPLIESNKSVSPEIIQ